MIKAKGYINPLTDFGFKKLFGTEVHKDFMISFLNEFLPEHHKIKELEYTNVEKIGENPDARKAVFDLHCKTQNNDRIVVEVQRGEQVHFRERSIYYSTFPIREQATRGKKWKFNLDAVYFIAVINFEFDVPEIPKRVIHKVHLKDQDNQIFYDKLSYTYIELPNFTKEADELTTLVDKWLYILKHLGKLQNRPPTLQERIFSRFFEAAEVAKLSLAEQEKYERSLEAYTEVDEIVNSVLLKSTRRTAEKMKAENIPNEVIAKVTGLSEEEIAELF